MRTPDLSDADPAVPFRAIAIVNPATGRVPVEAVERRLKIEAERSGVALTIHRTERPGHAIDLARLARDRFDLLVAVGGDGTVSDVVTGALESGVPVAIIPAGSTNIIARELGIPAPIRAAAELAFGPGHDIEIDVARAGATTFMHIAGAGFDAAIMRDTPPRWKRRVGWLAYVPPAVRNLNAPRFSATLTIDGQTQRTRARLVLLAVGGSIVHPRFKLASGVSRSDGVLDVLVYDPPNALGALAAVVWIGVGRPERSRWLTHLRGRRVRLEADRPVPFEVDGDVAGELPVEVELLWRAALMRVPDIAVRRARS